MTYFELFYNLSYMSLESILEKTDLASLRRGYVRHSGHYSCIYCSSRFEQGIIYPSESLLMDAERAAADHVEKAHGGAFTALLEQDRSLTGLSELQAELLAMLYSGDSDAEIARKSGGKAESTIRNHRFQLRKRTKEAKILCTLMDLLDEHNEKKESVAAEFYRFAGPLTVNDERVIVTNREAEKIKKKYLTLAESREGTAGLSGTAVDADTDKNRRLELRRWPKKQKEKLVVLDSIVRLFSPEREYTEEEVNSVLSEVYEDYVTLRRYLIDYGLLLRQPGGGVYHRSAR